MERLRGVDKRVLKLLQPSKGHLYDENLIGFLGEGRNMLAITRVGRRESLWHEVARSSFEHDGGATPANGENTIGKDNHGVYHDRCGSTITQIICPFPINVMPDVIMR